MNQIRILISDELKEKFKKYCNDNDKNMTKVIIRLIREEIKKNDRNLPDNK